MDIVKVGEPFKCSKQDPCTCEVKDYMLLVNHSIIWHDGDIIHDPNKGGCGKWIRDWDAG